MHTKPAPANCRRHQTWDFDCGTCVAVAANRTIEIKERAERDLVGAMSSAPSTRPAAGPRSVPRSVPR